MPDWISTATELPPAFTKVNAKDDTGNEFVAMLTAPGDVWAYADKKRYGVAAIVKFWYPMKPSKWGKFTEAIGKSAGEWFANRS